jgi:hypothetical protein
MPSSISELQEDAAAASALADASSAALLSYLREGLQQLEGAAGEEDVEVRRLLAQLEQQTTLIHELAAQGSQQAAPAPTALQLAEQLDR